MQSTDQSCLSCLALLEYLTIRDCFSLESVQLLGDEALKFSLETFILDFNQELRKVQIDRPLRQIKSFWDTKYNFTSQRFVTLIILTKELKLL
jgi:hypothetical protein